MAPCTECRGVAGHTIRCPHGPGPATAPSVAELMMAAGALEWPALAVRVPDRDRPIVVGGARRAWAAFMRWCEIRPSYALAAWDALERFEAAWRAEAPVPPPEVTV